jgi:hypothetical protein
MTIATLDEELVGFVDYCDDPSNPQNVYLSPIQIEASHKGRTLFKLLPNLLISVKS